MEEEKQLFRGAAIVCSDLARWRLSASGFRLFRLKCLSDEEAPVGRAHPGHVPLLANGRADAARRSRGLCLFQGNGKERLVQILGIGIDCHQTVQNVPAQGLARQVSLLVAGSRARRRAVAGKEDPSEIAWSGKTRCHRRSIVNRH
jgi:hypothetical protein